VIADAAPAPVQPVPTLAAVRSTTAPGPGYPRYDIVLYRPGRKLRVVVGDSLRSRVRPMEFGRLSWSPHGRRIAFATDLRRNSGSANDIYTVRADGTHLRRLTRTRGAFEPVWSPGGKTIVFSRHSRLREKPPYLTSTLWAMRPDGSHRRRLTHSGARVLEFPESFSPDGKSLLFARTSVDESGRVDPNASGLFVMDVASSAERRLMVDGGAATYSPDGRQIAYVSTRDRNGELNYAEQTTPAAELYVMRADGTHQRRLTRTHDLNEANPSWSSDGKRIAYQRGKVIENAQGMVIREIRPNGTRSRPLLADPKLDTWFNNPAWRP